MAYPSVSYTFTNGTVADGANVSTNFSNLVSGLSDGTKDLNMNAATFAGNLTANGNIVLGNAASDTVILTGIVSLATSGSYLSNLLGTVLLPTYTFTGDVNTGMWSSGADTLNFSTAGVDRLRLESTGQVSIGAPVTATSSILNIYNGSTSNNGVVLVGDVDNTRFTLYGNTNQSFQGFGHGGTFAAPTASAGGQILVALEARGYGTSFTGTKGSIQLTAEALWTLTSNPVAMSFQTTPVGSVTPAERLGISSAGVISIGTGGIISNVLGAVGAPSYTFTGDLNTGIWSSGADALDFSTAGAQRIRINSSGNIGIATTTHTRKLTVFGAGETAVTDAGAKTAAILVTDDSGSADRGGSIEFGSNSLATAQFYFAAIKGLLVNGSTNTTGDLAFYTRATVGATSLVERMRITFDGNVGVGTTTANAKLTVTGASATSNAVGILRVTTGTGATTDESLVVGIVDGSYTWMQALKNGTAYRDLVLQPTSANVGLAVIPTARNNCYVQVGSGIGFPATQVASTDVNTLDDYEEGTYTPTAAAATPGGTPPTFGTCTGTYTKIGNVVHVFINIPLTAAGTASGELYTSLPTAFAPAQAPYAIAYGRETALGGKMLQGYIATGVTNILHVTDYSNAAPTWTNGANFALQITYTV